MFKTGIRWIYQTFISGSVWLVLHLFKLWHEQEPFRFHCSIFPPSAQGWQVLKCVKMVQLWLHLTIIWFGRELLSSHQIIENPKKQVWQTWSKTCAAAELPMPHWQEDRLKNIDEHNKRVPSIQVITRVFVCSVRLSQKLRVSFVLPFCPKATCPLSRALNKAAIGLGSSTVHYCRSSYKLTSNRKMKNKKIWYYSTAIACNINYGSTHACLCFSTCLNLSSRLKIGKLFVHVLFLFVVFSCVLSFCLFTGMVPYIDSSISSFYPNRKSHLPEPTNPRSPESRHHQAFEVLSNLVMASGNLSPMSTWYPS